MSRKHAKGFTLIELMITVVIVGILMTIAFASYTWAVERGRRAEGAAALLGAAQQLERFFTTNNSYTVSLTDAQIPVTTESGMYTLSVAPNGNINTGFTLTATPTGWSDAKCGALTLNNAGVKGESGSGSVQDCW